MLRATLLRVGPAALALLTLAAGCGPSGPRRYPASGAVTIGGKPVQKGLITFDPDLSKQKDGPQGFAFIENGRYDTAAPNGRGTVGGPLKVKIEGTTDINGQRSRLAHVTAADLPLGPGVQDFDIPAAAASKAPVGLEP